MTGCKTLEVKHKIELPPKPERQELKEPKDLKDIAELLNYYEHLVQEYEVWADTVTKIIEEP